MGLNAARSLEKLGHEFIVIEQRPRRYELLRPELGDRLLFGDGTEMWVLEQAGITRADLVVAVTGDDEDNVVIAQLAKHEYHVPKVVGRINDPRNRPTFDLLEVDATICASTMVISMIQHELPSHRFVPLLSLKRENVEVVEIEVGDDSPAAHLPVREVRLPDGVLVATVLRGEEAITARADTVPAARRPPAVPAAAGQGEGAHPRAPARRTPRSGAGAGQHRDHGGAVRAAGLERGGRR